MTAIGPTHQHHRVTDVALPAWERRTVAVWGDVTNIIRDKPGSGFSMTKIIAAYFAYLTGVSIRLQGGVITSNALWLALASLAAAFGKSTFNYLLSKAALSTASVQSDARSFERKEVETTTRIDAHYTIDGSGASVPATSLPPVVGAKTPSGEE